MAVLQRRWFCCRSLCGFATACYRAFILHTEFIGTLLVCVFGSVYVFDNLGWGRERLSDVVYFMSRDMTKPTKWVCAQRRLRSAWASAQSDQSLRCPHEETLGPWLSIERTAKTLICPGWSESSLGVHSFCLFCHVAAHLLTVCPCASFSSRCHGKAEMGNCGTSFSFVSHMHDIWASSRENLSSGFATR